ncbi:MAG: hypothetical protein ACI4VK_03250 [Candidatus Coproplasma sp.]
MQIVDWIALGIILLVALIGIMLGFGKCLKIFTGGVVGIIISVVVTYFLIGIVGSWGFVNNLLTSFKTLLAESGNGILIFLNNIGIETIVLAIVLFIIVQLLRILIVNIIQGIAEADNVVMKIINKGLGMIFALAFFIMIALIVFQIIYLIGGDTADNFREYLTGAFKLNYVFDNNPLHVIADMWLGTPAAA